MVELSAEHPNANSNAKKCHIQNVINIVDFKYIMSWDRKRVYEKRYQQT